MASAPNKPQILTPVQGAFRALSDPTRRAILMHLSRHDMTIGDIVERFDVTRAAIKKHLTILEEGNLIHVEAHGRERINRLQPEGLKAVADWVAYFDRFWDDRLSALQVAVEQHEDQKREQPNIDAQISAINLRERDK